MSLRQSRSSSQLCTYVCTVPVPNFHEQPTAEADRTINVSEFAATCDSSLRLMMVFCDSVLIQDCDLSQRDSISLGFSMPRPMYVFYSKQEGNSNGVNLRVGLVNWS